MKTHWRVYRHPEVVNYLISLRERGTMIRWVVSQLVDGLPSEAKPRPVGTRNKLNHLLWVDERHWITCRVEEEEHAIYVTNVEPRLEGYRDEATPTPKQS